jgi:hypothetical protein
LNIETASQSSLFHNQQMTTLTRRRRLIVGVLTSGTGLTLLLVSGGPAAATPATSSGVAAPRPATVPADYTLTPNGYFHPDCIHELGQDQILVPDGTSTAIVDIAANPAAATLRTNVVGPAASPGAGGAKAGIADTVTAEQIARSPHVPACAHKRYDAGGREVVPDAPTQAPAGATVPTINGWVESANTHSLGAMSYIHAEWNIPAAPATRTTQTVYFFPGFEHYGGTTTIMQPVLAWNQGGSGIAGWSAASWNCCHSGSTFHSAYIPAPGSMMSGDVSGNGCNTSTGVCSSWAITTYIWSSQRSTTLNTSPFGLSMNWVFGGALEVYSVSTCGQLPGGNVKFRAFYMEDVRNVIKTPTWTRAPASGFTPACAWGVTIGSDRSVTLDY